MEEEGDATSDYINYSDGLKISTWRVRGMRGHRRILERIDGGQTAAPTGTRYCTWIWQLRREGLEDTPTARVRVKQRGEVDLRRHLTIVDRLDTKLALAYRLVLFTFKICS